MSDRWRKRWVQGDKVPLDSLLPGDRFFDFTGTLFVRGGRFTQPSGRTMIEAVEIGGVPSGLPPRTAFLPTINVLED